MDLKLWISSSAFQLSSIFRLAPQKSLEIILWSVTGVTKTQSLTLQEQTNLSRKRNNLLGSGKDDGFEQWQKSNKEKQKWCVGKKPSEKNSEGQLGRVRLWSQSLNTGKGAEEGVWKRKNREGGRLQCGNKFAIYHVSGVLFALKGFQWFVLPGM